jgi:hypothetical protein
MVYNRTRFCFGPRLEGLRRGCLLRCAYHCADIHCFYTHILTLTLHYSVTNIILWITLTQRILDAFGRSTLILRDEPHYRVVCE